MKRKQTYKIICIIVMFLINIILWVPKVSATISVYTSGSWNYGYDNPYFPGKYTKIGSKTHEVYCSEFMKEIPKTCWEDTSWDENSYDAAGIARIINNKDLSYGRKEILINYYLQKRGYTYNCQNSTSCPYAGAYGVRGDAYPYYIYLSGDVKTYAHKGYENIKAFLDGALDSRRTKKGSIKVNKFKRNSDLIKGSVYVYNNGYLDTNYTISVKTNKGENCSVSRSRHIEYTTGYGNQREDLQVTCPNTSGADEVTVTVQSKNLYTTKRYNCGSNYQKVFINDTKKRSYTKTVEVTAPPEEVCTPADSIQCQCVAEFNANKDKPSFRRYRISMYQSYLSKHEVKYNNLLNFNIENAMDACSQVNCGNDELNVSCMSGNTNANDDFDGNNLSCFDDKNVFNQLVADFVFCQTGFELTSPHSAAFQNTLETNSGQALYKTSQQLALEGKLTRICYIYSREEDEIIEDALSKEIFNYKNIVGNVSLIYEENKNDITKTNFLSLVEESDEIVKYKDIERVQEGNDVYYSFSAEKTFKYNFIDISYKILTGANVFTNTNAKFETGYFGVPGKFTDIELPGNLIFSYEFSSGAENKGKEMVSASCPYIIHPTNSGEPIDLEFRTVGTTNSFVGRNGITRNVGTNWCSKTPGGNVVSCQGSEEENELIKSIMEERNDSYNKTGEGPKYVIELTPAIIGRIRNYNSDVNHPYDDNSGLDCKTIIEGEDENKNLKNYCISDYLTLLRDSGNLEIINSENRRQFRNDE